MHIYIYIYVYPAEPSGPQVGALLRPRDPRSVARGVASARPADRWCIIIIKYYHL